MSHMKKLLESMSKYSASESINEEEYCDACDRVKSKCICDDDLAEALMNEYRDFVPAPANEEGHVDALSPVANINPRSRNQQHMVDEADVDPVTGEPVTPVPGQPQQPTKPGQPAQQAQPGQPGQPAQQAQPTKPGQPAPVNPQQTAAINQLKQATGNTKIVPAKAAAAAAVAQSNPQALNPDQKIQLQQLGQAVAPAIDSPQDVAKIKSVLPQAPKPGAQAPQQQKVQ